MRGESLHCPQLYPGNYSENKRFHGNLPNKYKTAAKIDSFVYQTDDYNLSIFYNPLEISSLIFKQHLYISIRV